MDVVNRMVAAPTQAHLIIDSLMLPVVVFVLLAYTAILFGGTLWSIFFSFLDWDTPKDVHKKLSKALCHLAVPNPAVSFFFTLVPLGTLLIMFAEEQYNTQQLTVLTLSGALVGFVVAIALLLAYRKSFDDREAHFGRHILLGLAGFAVLSAVAFTVATGLTLSYDPEQWPLIRAPYGVFLCSWNVIARFTHFTFLSFAMVGGALLLTYFRSPDAEGDQDPDSRRYIRNFAAGLVLLSCLLLPVFGFWNVITIPDVGMTLPVYGLVMAGLIVLAIVAVGAFRTRISSNVSGGGGLLIGVLVFLLLFSVAEEVARANATGDWIEWLAFQAHQTQEKAESNFAETASATVKPDMVTGKRVFTTVCYNCHRFNTRLVGPPLLQVLPKYRGNPEKLVDFITHPRMLNPGYPPMPAQTQLSPVELASVARYELSHLKGK